jgi:superfamily II DNA or RNA helicase
VLSVVCVRDSLAAAVAGAYDAIVTSRVLNEGIDVPEASVGIVVSGTGSVREHVQRLGRLLRPRQGKRAILYELVSAGTAELYVSQRRRQHRAYQGSA